MNAKVLIFNRLGVLRGGKERGFVELIFAFHHPAGADAPGMVDYMIWPWVERLSIFKLVYPDLSDYENDKKENPRLVSMIPQFKAQ